MQSAYSPRSILEAHAIAQHAADLARILGTAQRLQAKAQRIRTAPRTEEETAAITAAAERRLAEWACGR